MVRDEVLVVEQGRPRWGLIALVAVFLFVVAPCLAWMAADYFWYRPIREDYAAAEEAGRAADVAEKSALAARTDFTALLERAAADKREADRGRLYSAAQTALALTKDAEAKHRAAVDQIQIARDHGWSKSRKETDHELWLQEYGLLRGAAYLDAMWYSEITAYDLQDLDRLRMRHEMWSRTSIDSRAQAEEVRKERRFEPH